VLGGSELRANFIDARTKASKQLEPRYNSTECRSFMTNYDEISRFIAAVRATLYNSSVACTFWHVRVISKVGRLGTKKDV